MKLAVDAAVTVGLLLVVGLGCAHDSDVGSPASADTVATAAPRTELSTETSTIPSTSAEQTSIEGVSGTLVLTRQRDLLDRGLINVEFVNDSSSDLTITDRQLVSDLFDTEPAEPRTSKVPDGRQVHLQVPYGTAVECDRNDSVAAQLEFVYGTADADEPAAAIIELDGVELLDEIRAEQCAQFAFDAAVDTDLVTTAVDAETLDADLIVAPTGDHVGMPIEIEHADGTILVDAAIVEPQSVNDGGSVSVPVRFSVTRCDPHALAEVTKRFGLELTVSIDGASSQTIDVDVTPLDDDLDTIVAHCQDRTS